MHIRHGDFRRQFFPTQSDAPWRQASRRPDAPREMNSTGRLARANGFYDKEGEEEEAERGRMFSIRNEKSGRGRLKRDVLLKLFPRR